MFLYFILVMVFGDTKLKMNFKNKTHAFSVTIIIHAISESSIAAFFHIQNLSPMKHLLAPALTIFSNGAKTLQSTFARVLVVVLLSLIGTMTTIAKVIIPFGQVNKQAWSVNYYYAQQGANGPADDWYALDFDDRDWGTLSMPISSENGLEYYNTARPDERCRYWVRSHFTLEEIDKTHGFYIPFSHDDECTIYLNGTKLFDQGGTANWNIHQLTEAQMDLLKKGDNVLCMYVYDSGGGGMYMDFGLYEDDGDFQELVTSDVPVTFTNDETNPWTLNGSNAVNGNRGKAYSTSWLTMSYYSTRRVELKFDWYEYNYSTHQPLQLYIDGVLQSTTNNSSWTTPRYYIDAGEHVIAFRDSIGSNGNSNNNSGIRNIRLREILPLRDALLTKNSKKISFTNTSETPWTIEDGYVEHNNYGVPNTGSRFSSTFSLTKIYRLTFERRLTGPYNNEGYHNFILYVNGVQYLKEWNSSDFSKFSVALEHGKYTVEWVDTVYNRSETYSTQIRNVELRSPWVEVELATAGTLGYEVLYSPGVNVLNDVEFLKVTGPMNASDWTDIKNMNNLLGLDLSEAQITELPNQVFDGKSLLSSVILPEGLKTIGEYAFRGTTIRQINIPSTVITIGQRAFEGTPLAYLTFVDNAQINSINPFAFNNCTSLQSIDFGDNSQLQTIGERAFSSCTALKSIIFGKNSVLTTIGRGAFAWCRALTTVKLPDSVTDLSYGVFQECTSLNSITFSDAMTIINDHVCYGCTALQDVHLPVALKGIYTRSFSHTTSLKQIDFPATLNEIRSDAFWESGLESIVLPIGMQYLYRYAFSGCKSLKSVVLPSYLERGATLGYYDYAYSADGSMRYNDNYRHYGYRLTFVNCTALEKVVMRSATPPVIDEDPFSDARAKSAITLVVPSFAVVSYKLDTYWYQFGKIIEGDDVDYWKITSPLMLTNNRRMKGTPDIDLYFGGQLTVGGSAPFTTDIFNLYVNESNPGRLLNTCENMTATTAATKFAVEANRWYFFTPIFDVAISDIDVSNNASYVFRYYDAQNRAVNGASGSWKNVDTDVLKAGQGYIFHCNTACEVTFPANSAGKLKLFNTNDVTMTLNVNESSTTANRSWNYVGNPYPCYYDIYYMDFTAPITVWNGSTYKAYSIADDEFVLRPMQSFFVQKPDAVDQIIFHKEGRQVTTDIVHGAASAPARKAVPANRFLFNLEIQSEGQSDETRVVINNLASLDYEISCDAAKFMSFDAGVPQIYTLDPSGNGYAINERPIDDGEVQLAYYAGREGIYTIHALRTDGEVWLYDADEDCSVNLTKEDYVFESLKTSTANTSRFTLTFKAGADNITGIDRLTDASSENDETVYDLQGRKVNNPGKGIFIQNGKKVMRK